MQINVAQLLKESNGATRTYDIEGAVSTDDAEECQVTGKVVLTRAARKALSDYGVTRDQIRACLGQKTPKA